jgi:hypothetical protein
MTQKCPPVENLNNGRILFFPLSGVEGRWKFLEACSGMGAAPVMVIPVIIFVIRFFNKTIFPFCAKFKQLPCPDELLGFHL